jgi:hypothetical protein
MSDDSDVWAFIGGILCGIPAVAVLFVLIWFSSFLFDGFHPTPSQERLAAQSVGADLYWISLLIGLIVGMYAVFASKLKRRLRVFLLGLALPMLGLLSLCSYLGVHDLISGTHS